MNATCLKDTNALLFRTRWPVQILFLGEACGNCKWMVQSGALIPAINVEVLGPLLNGLING